MAGEIKEDMSNVDDMLTVRPGDDIEEEDKKLAAFRVLIQSPFDASMVVKVKKSQLTLDFVCNKFQCHVAFLQEKKTGAIIWPTRWAMDCLPTPAVYIAALQPPEQTSSDAMEEDEYRGQSMVCIFEVAEEVSELAIAAWFQTGLNDEFPDLVDAKEHLQELNSKLEYVSNQISLLPNLKSAVAENVDEELEFRKQRAQALARLQQDLRDELDRYMERKRQLEDEADGKHVQYSLVLGKRTPPLNFCIWEVHFKPGAEGEELAFLASHKTNWSDYYLRIVRNGNSAIAGKGTPPEGGVMKSVDMKAVKVARVKHGKGMHRLKDGKGFYSGMWRHGLPHGVGTLINANGRFQACMDDGRLSGQATIVYSRGDVYKGQLGFQPTRKIPSAMNGMEYADGIAMGAGRLDFVDGSRYDGSFHDGACCGPGQYFDTSGTVFDGGFDEFGMLSGQCAATNEEFAKIGWWRHGSMDKEGTEIDMQLGTYNGDFRFSLRHGFGRLDNKAPKGVYIGDFKNDFKDGRGLFDFLAPETSTGTISPTRPSVHLNNKKINPTKFSEQTVVDLPEFTRFRSEGRWRCGAMRGGGVFTDTEDSANPLDFRLFYTMDRRNPTLPELDKLASLEAQITAERENRQRAGAASILAQRMAKETDNMKRYAFWVDVAAEKMHDVINKNRLDRSALHAIAAAVEEKKAKFKKVDTNLKVETPEPSPSKLPPDSSDDDEALRSPRSPTVRVTSSRKAL